MQVRLEMLMSFSLHPSNMSHVHQPIQLHVASACENKVRFKRFVHNSLDPRLVFGFRDPFSARSDLTAWLNFVSVGDSTLPHVHEV